MDNKANREIMLSVFLFNLVEKAFSLPDNALGPNPGGNSFVGL